MSYFYKSNNISKTHCIEISHIRSILHIYLIGSTAILLHLQRDQQ